MEITVRNHREHCLAYKGNYPDIISDHTLCPIANQELKNIDGTSKRGGCRRCNRSHHNGDPVTTCEGTWYVCVKCYPAHCALYKSREPELIEAKIGEVKWI